MTNNKTSSADNVRFKFPSFNADSNETEKEIGKQVLLTKLVAIVMEAFFAMM